jgi:hypothetical protein
MIIPAVMLAVMSSESLCFAGNASVSNMKLLSDKEIVLDLEIPDAGPVESNDLSGYINNLPVETAVLPGETRKDELNIIYLVVSVDSSRSISAGLLKKIKSEAKLIVRERGERELIALYRFNDDIVLLSQFTGNKPALERNIDSISAHGEKTLLYNSLFDSIDKLQKMKGPGKGVIVFTDGKDEGSNMTVDDIVSLARDARIAVNFITVRRSRETESIARIAKGSGGGVSYIDEPWSEQKYKMHLPEADAQIHKIKITSPVPIEVQASIDLRIKSGSNRYRVVSPFVLSKDSTEKKKNIGYSQLAFLAAASALCVFLCGLCLYLNKKKKITKGKDAEHSHYELPSDGPAEDDTLLSPFPHAWLIEKDSTEKGQKFVINEKEISIGQLKDNAIIIQDMSASPFHAKIRLIKDTFYIFDLASEHGTFLNGKKLLRPKPLRDWDELSIGTTVFTFRFPEI